MRQFVIVGLKVLIAMIGLFLSFIIWASLFDDYPWRERILPLIAIAAMPVCLWGAIRLLDARRRAGAALALLCVLLGPTPMFFEASWIWSIILGIPLVIVWFQLGGPTGPSSIGAREAS